LSSEVIKDVSQGGAIAGELGVRLTAFMAAFFCLVGLFFFRMYDEKGILKIISQEK